MTIDGAIVDIEIIDNIIMVFGEVDINTASAVEEALLSCLNSGNTDVILDLSEVTYFDSSGIQALLKAREAMPHRCNAIKIVGVNPHTDRVFKLIGLERFFEIEVRTI